MTAKTQSIILLPSAARIATPANIDIDQTRNEIKITGSRDTIRGQLTNIHIIVDVTAAAATPIVTPTIQALDPASGKFYDLLPSIATITGISTTVYKIGKDMIVTAGLSATDFLTETIRIAFTHTDTDSITYSVGMNYEIDLDG